MTKASGVFAGEVTSQAPAHNSPTSKRKGYHYFEYGVPGPVGGNCCAVWNVAALTPDLHVAGEVTGIWNGDIIIGTGILEDDRIDSIYTTDDTGGYIKYVGSNPGQDDGVAEVFYPECQWYNYSGPFMASTIGGGTVDFGDWTLVEGIGTTSLDQDGLDGQANFASTATDTDTGSQYVLRSRSSLNTLIGTTAFTCRMLVRKEVSVPHYARFELNPSDGVYKAGYWTFNTETGDLVLVGTAGADVNPDSEVRDNGDWWEVYLQIDSNGDSNNEGMIIVWPAVNLDGSSSKVDLTTGSITFADHTIYSETPISVVRGGGVEPKIGGADPASVIDQSNVHLDAANHSNIEGGYYFEWRPIYSHSEISADVELLSLNDATGLLYYDYSTQLLTATDGTNTATVPLTLTKETKYRCAVAFGSGLMRVGINGAWGVEVAYDGAFAGGSDFTVCRNPLNVNYWRELRGYRIPYADAIDELFLLMTLCGTAPEVAYDPGMMTFNGVDAYYTDSTPAHSGNLVTCVIRFNIASFTGGDHMRLVHANTTTGARMLIRAWSSDYVIVGRRDKISITVQDDGGTEICNLFSLAEVVDGNDHTLSIAFDADNGTAIFYIDGVDADDIGNAERIAPTTGTLDLTGDSLNIGARNGGGNYVDGQLGYFGISNLYLTNPADFYDPIDGLQDIESTLSIVWGGTPLQWNQFATMTDNKGSAGNMTDVNSSITGPT